MDHLSLDVSPIRILSSKDVQLALKMEEAIAINRKAFMVASDGQANIPSRIILDVPSQKGATLFKPAHLQSGELGIKIVSVRPENATLGLPTVPGFIMLLDEKTGFPLCLMDGTYLTALRTAAGSAAATDALARKDASTLVVFGAGLQARAHIEAICCVRDIKTIYICNRTVSKAEILAKEINQWKPTLTVLACADGTGCIDKADIVVTATNSSKPLFNGETLKRGAHINGIGSYTNEMQELDVTTIKRAKVFTDSEEALKAGDLYIPFSQQILKKEDVVIGDIGRLFIDGSKLFERSQDTDLTLFKSVGTAVQDIATAAAVYNSAVTNNLGITAKL